MTESKEIALLPVREKAIDVYSTEKGLDPYLKHIRDELDAFVPDVTTKKGREAIASMAYKVAQSKSALDKLGKELVDELKEKPKLVDAERKRMRDTLDAWKDEVRKPLTDFEEREQQRIEKIESWVANIKAFAFVNDLAAAGIQVQIQNLQSIVVDGSFDEFEAQAHRAKTESLEALNRALDARQKYEAEQEELARLRAEAVAREQKEREERIAREAAENARIAAERAAAAEQQRLKDEAAAKEREQQLAIERAQRERAEAEAAALRQQQEAERAAAKAKQDAIDAAARAEAEKQAAIEAERKRQADQLTAERAEEERRAKDKAHAKAINNQILEDMISAGCSDKCAKAIITAIARGQVRHTTINY